MPSGWASLRPFLAQRFHVVQFDQRGHGRTDNPGGGDAYTLATLAADAAALIEQLGLAPVHVAGWSEGGIVGLGLALDHPSVLQSLIGIGTNYTNDARTVAELATLDADGFERDRPAAATALAQRHDPHHEPGCWKELLRWIVTSETDVPAYTAADLARITEPTLWIAGDDDPWFELSQPLAMKRHIPRAELLIVRWPRGAADAPPSRWSRDDGFPHPSQSVAQRVTAVGSIPPSAALPAQRRFMSGSRRATR